MWDLVTININDTRNKFLMIIATVMSLFISTFSFGLSSDKQLTDLRMKELVHMVRQDCGSCHGMTLKGGLGPALTKEALANKPLLMIKNTIIFGRKGTAMPPWKDIITEQEALWISQQLLLGMKNDN